MSGVGVFRRQKLNLLFVETEHSRVCLSQNITTTNILAVTTIFTFFSSLLRFQKNKQKNNPLAFPKKYMHALKKLAQLTLTQTRKSTRSFTVDVGLACETANITLAHTAAKHNLKSMKKTAALGKGK